MCGHHVLQILTAIKATRVVKSIRYSEIKSLVSANSTENAHEVRPRYQT
jgi:hypothetical protein